MISRVTVVVIILKVQTRKGQGKVRSKVKDKALTETIVERTDESNSNETSQANVAINKTVPEMRISQSWIWYVPKESKPQKYTARAMHFTAWCLGSDELNSHSFTAGRLVVRIWRVAEYCLIVKRPETMEANIEFRADHDWVFLVINNRPVYKFGDAKRKTSAVKGQSVSATWKTRGTFTCACPRNGEITFIVLFS